MCHDYALPGISDSDLETIFDYRLPKAVEISSPFHRFLDSYEIKNVLRVNSQRENEIAVFVRVDVQFSPDDLVYTYYFRVNDGKTRSNPNTQTDKRS